MRKKLVHRNGFVAVLTTVIVLFLGAQILTSAHAAKYGDGPHDHGGQVCVLSLASVGGEKFLTAGVIAVVLALASFSLSQTMHWTQPVRIRVSARRPRGPPSI